MATNGASARQWLQEHGQSASHERLTQIRNAIAERLERAEAESDESQGLLEALDVMDSFIATRAQPEQQSSEDIPLDSSPLIQEETPAPAISRERRRARFEQLMKEGRIEPELD